MVLVPSLDRGGKIAIFLPKIRHKCEQGFKSLAEISLLRSSKNWQNLHTVQCECGGQV